MADDKRTYPNFVYRGEPGPSGTVTIRSERVSSKEMERDYLEKGWHTDREDAQRAAPLAPSPQVLISQTPRERRDELLEQTLTHLLSRLEPPAPPLARRPSRKSRRRRTRKPQDNPPPVPPAPRQKTCAAARRAAVNAYIAEVWRVKKRRLTRTDIWKEARYTDSSEFERWQRCDPKTTKTADERFPTLLKEKPHLK